MWPSTELISFHQQCAFLGQIWGEKQSRMKLLEVDNQQFISHSLPQCCSGPAQCLAPVGVGLGSWWGAWGRAAVLPCQLPASRDTADSRQTRQQAFCSLSLHSTEFGHHSPKARCSGFNPLPHRTVQIWRSFGLHSNFCLTWAVLLGDEFLANRDVWVAGTDELSQCLAEHFPGKEWRSRAKLINYQLIVSKHTSQWASSISRPLLPSVSFACKLQRKEISWIGHHSIFWAWNITYTRIWCYHVSMWEKQYLCWDFLDLKKMFGNCRGLFPSKILEYLWERQQIKSFCYLASLWRRRR